jgi:hypothetical protein
MQKIINKTVTEVRRHVPGTKNISDACVCWMFLGVFSWSFMLPFLDRRGVGLLEHSSDMDRGIHCGTEHLILECSTLGWFTNWHIREMSFKWLDRPLWILSFYFTSSAHTTQLTGKPQKTASDWPSPRTRVVVKLTAFPIVVKSHHMIKPKLNYRFRKSWPFSEQDGTNPWHPTQFHEDTFIMLTSHIRARLPIYFFLLGFPVQKPYTFIFSRKHITCPAHCTNLDLITRIIFGME